MNAYSHLFAGTGYSLPPRLSMPHAQQLGQMRAHSHPTSRGATSASFGGFGFGFGQQRATTHGAPRVSVMEAGASALGDGQWAAVPGATVVYSATRNEIGVVLPKAGVFGSAWSTQRLPQVCTAFPRVRTRRPKACVRSTGLSGARLRFVHFSHSPSCAQTSIPPDGPDLRWIRFTQLPQQRSCQAMPRQKPGRPQRQPRCDLRRGARERAG